MILCVFPQYLQLIMSYCPHQLARLCYSTKSIFQREWMKINTWADHKCQLTRNLLSRLSCHPMSSYATVLVRESDKSLTLELNMVADTCTRRLRQEDHKFEANLNFILRLCLRSKRFLIRLMIHNKYSNAFICLTGLLLQQYIFPST